MKTEFKVSGMHCNSCIALIKMDLEEMPGVREVKGDYQKGTILVDYDEKKANVKTMPSKIEGNGYKVLTQKNVK
jgi:copper chaperone CopZ